MSMTTRAEEETARPRQLGLPLKPETWSEVPASVPKAAEAIQIGDSELRAFDRRLMNVLLAHSYDGLLQDPYRVFWAACSELKKPLGWSRSNGNQAIKNALRRLQRTLVYIYYSDDEALRERSLSLLIMADVPVSKGYVTWRFNPELSPLLANPTSYARIFLPVNLGLRSSYAVRLCENLSLYSGAGEWITTPDRLRSCLGATAKTYEDYRHLSYQVIEPALDEINERAEFSARFFTERNADGEVARVRFEIELKDKWRVLLACNGIEKSVKTVAGRRFRATAREVDAVASRVKSAGRGVVSREFPGMPVDALVREWARWRLECRHDVHKPSEDFKSYVRALYGAFAGGGAPEEDPGDDQRCACDAVRALHQKQRDPWINLAVSRGIVDRHPGTSIAAFHLWLPAMKREMRASGAIPSPEEADEEEPCPEWG